MFQQTTKTYSAHVRSVYVHDQDVHQMHARLRGLKRLLTL